MNELNLDFEGHAVRVVARNGEPWWVAADVCDSLGLANVSEALRRLDDDEKDTLSNAEGITKDNRAQSIAVINESGLYSLILRSRKPEAKRFKRWVTREVLPAIRRTGSYSAAEQGVELQLRPDAPVDIRAIVTEAAEAAATAAAERMIGDLRRSAGDLVALARSTTVDGESIPEGLRVYLSNLVRRIMFDEGWHQSGARRVTEGVVATLRDKEFIGERVLLDPTAPAFDVRKSAPAFPMWYVHERYRDLARKVVRAVLAQTPNLKRDPGTQMEMNFGKPNG